MMKKWVIGLALALPLWAQAEVCLNYGCVILYQKQKYDAEILPEWNRLKTLAEKSSSIDKQTQFILDNYEQWRDVSIAECTAASPNALGINIDGKPKEKSCVNHMIDKRIIFLKQRNEQLENQIQP